MSDTMDTNANSTSKSSPVTDPETIASNAETIYEFGRQLDSPSHVVSEKVQTLAAQIYTELQRIINRCNEDEEVVAGLMPLVVNVLESLDLTLIENQQFQVELELCKDDNEQLVLAFEKEKLHKKKVEQRLFEFEFQTDEEKGHYQQKIDSLANIVKMLELKAKNSSDHSTRLEEKETEMKKEYNKLHDRYTEVLRSHCDLMERVKILIGSDEGMASLGANNLTNFSINVNKIQINKKIDLEGSGEEGNYSEHMARRDSNSPTPRQAWAETELSYDDNPSIIEDVDDISRDRECQSLTGQYVHPSEYASTGMEKEIENLITENNELLATKNALNIVKDDLITKVDELQSELQMCANEIQQRDAVKERLKSRISALEEELKKAKEEFEEAKQKLLQQKEDDEEGIPMAQRKRFTRVEMARVLMERNQYKERLIELQEAIRWSELIKATKSEGEKKSAIWKFGRNWIGFSNLFSTTSSPQNTKELTRSNGAGSGSPAVRFSASNPTAVTPALDAMRKRARAHHSGAGNDLLLLMDSDLSSERSRALRSVRAHVNRTGNGDRIQAYGWSITGATTGGNGGNQTEERMASNAIKGTSVPVPIYCRPLSGDDVGMKIWCASAVDLTGGEAGFPNDKIESESTPTSDQNKQIVETGNKEPNNALADLESELSQAMSEQSSRSTDSLLSTFVWICSVSHSKSKVTIVNIRSNPGEVLDSFNKRTHLLSIASIPGAKVNDMQGSDGIEVDGNEIKLVNRQDSRRESNQSDSNKLFDRKSIEASIESNQTIESKQSEETISIDNDSALESPAKGSTLDKLSEYVAYTEPPSPTGTADDISTSSSNVFQPMSTCLPTMWTGGQNGVLYVHSSIAQWSHCIATVKLSDSVLQIIHSRGRVFVALANGQCCVFVRSTLTGEWDFSKYYVLDIGFVANFSNTSSSDPSSKPVAPNTSGIGTNQMALYSIRCIESAKDMIWLGYRNLVFILNSKTLKVVHWFAVHPRKETQVRQLSALGDGVWVSLRLDSTLKLYSALKPYQHLQDVDIEPYVSKMLSPKAFSFIRITALKASNNRLWIGTANGVILSIPCGGSKDSNVSQSPSVVSSTASGRLSMSTFVPICNLTATQLSFHGHKDAVKFFVCTKNLILSGGEGYIDFRLNGDDDSNSLSKGDRSHLIVWELSP